MIRISSGWLWFIEGVYPQRMLNKLSKNLSLILSGKFRIFSFHVVIFLILDCLSLSEHAGNEMFRSEAGKRTDKTMTLCARGLKIFRENFRSCAGVHSGSM
jgi:hypothetical protein